MIHGNMNVKYDIIHLLPMSFLQLKVALRV